MKKALLLIFEDFCHQGNWFSLSPFRALELCKGNCMHSHDRFRVSSIIKILFRFLLPKLWSVVLSSIWHRIQLEYSIVSYQSKATRQLISLICAFVLWDSHLQIAHPWTSVHLMGILLHEFPLDGLEILDNLINLVQISGIPLLSKVRALPEPKQCLSVCRKHRGWQAETEDFGEDWREWSSLRRSREQRHNKASTTSPVTTTATRKSHQSGHKKIDADRTSI